MIAMTHSHRRVDFLHRDVTLVSRFFASHGVQTDPDEVFADLVSFIPWPR